METKNYDALILGTGPAGLTAGLYLARAKKKVKIIDSGAAGGQVLLSHQIANYPGVEELFGYKLAGIMKKQAKDFGCELTTNVTITHLSLNTKEKIVQINGKEEYNAPAIILANGGQPRNLGLTSEEKFKGKGISYCATCDGDFFTNHDIAVIGGGNSALEEAVALTKYAKSVSIIHQFDHFQAYAHAVEEANNNEKISFYLDSLVNDFLGEENLSGIRFTHNKTKETRELKITGAFIFIGYVPNATMYQGILPLSENGEIITDENMATSIPGVFAAGDIRKKRFRQITTATADGTIAALSAIDFIERNK